MSDDILYSNGNGLRLVTSDKHPKDYCLILGEKRIHFYSEELGFFPDMKASDLSKKLASLSPDASVALWNFKGNIGEIKEALGYVPSHQIS